jgi:hypothetical protein
MRRTGRAGVDRMKQVFSSRGRHFFGTGAPTWTTDRIELYLKPSE